MSDLVISYGGLLYWDRTLALQSGQVQASGVNLNYVVHESAPDLFTQQIREQTYDVCEMSAASFIILISRHDDRFVGLPLYLSRNFRHGQVYVHRKSGIRQPRDLVGRRIGVLDYQMTAALWIRAFLQHDYGVLPMELQWFTGGLTEPAWRERLGDVAPPGVSIERIDQDATLEGMLETGALDALVTAQPPRRFDSSPQNPVRRLFVQYESVEREYYRRTKLFPIMHLVVLRRSVHEANPWLAGNLVEAFEAAKGLGRRRLRATTGLAVGLPWLGAEIEEVDQQFGGDAFPYGFSVNEPTLTAMTGYAYEQGLTARHVDATELCLPEVR